MAHLPLLDRLAQREGLAVVVEQGEVGSFLAGLSAIAST